MFWRGFPNTDPAMTFTIALPTGRKKILPQNPLSTFSVSLDFVFIVVALHVWTGISGIARLARKGTGWVSALSAERLPVPVPPDPERPEM